VCELTPKSDALNKGNYSKIELVRKPTPKSDAPRLYASHS